MTGGHWHRLNATDRCATCNATIAELHERGASYSGYDGAYAHTLTDTERACGVTLEDVARELPRGLFLDNGATFMVAANVPPALAGSVARAAFGGPAEFSHLKNGAPIYRKAGTQ